jgi:hypothetical protein
MHSTEPEPQPNEVAQLQHCIDVLQSRVILVRPRFRLLSLCIIRSAAPAPPSNDAAPAPASQHEFFVSRHGTIGLPHVWAGTPMARIAEYVN